MKPHDRRDRPIGRIHVSRNGAITLDGARMSLQALRTSLADLRARQGVVWYYREAGETVAPTAAMAVMRLLVEQRLPVSLSTRPDFSDVVRPDGHVVPRTSPSTPS